MVHHAPRRAQAREKTMTTPQQPGDFSHWLFHQDCDFVKGVVAVKHLPPPDMVEIAFAGRSNVGKSSLINSLTNRKTLARTSNTPGRTKELNFFNLANQLMVVDLPGYGYAKVAKKVVSNWTGLIFDYLRGRANLKRVFVLIDSRHGLKDTDIKMMQELDKAAVTYQLVLTKVDKIKASDLEDLIDKIQTAIKKHPACHPDILHTSSVKKTGIEQLRQVIAELIES